MSIAIAQPPIPVIDKIHQRVYRAASRPGALNMEAWHCGTAHCRAGHIVDQAGPAGYALEAYENSCTDSGSTSPAARQILAASSGIEIMVSAFDPTTPRAVALADMARCAAEEAALVGVLGDDE